MIKDAASPFVHIKWVFVGAYYRQVSMHLNQMSDKCLWLNTTFSIIWIEDGLEHFFFSWHFFFRLQRKPKRRLKPVVWAIDPSPNTHLSSSSQLPTYLILILCTSTPWHGLSTCTSCQSMTGMFHFQFIIFVEKSVRPVQRRFDKRKEGSDFISSKFILFLIHIFA